MTPNSGSLVARFPKAIPISIYPRSRWGYILGGLWTVTNRPPSAINFLTLDEVYSVPKEGDYTLTVQPVLYRRSDSDAGVLDRVDLPAVTTRVHLVPNAK